MARHGGRPRYRASEADHQAWESALRPKACLLALHVKLQKIVAGKVDPEVTKKFVRTQARKIEKKTAYLAGLWRLHKSGFPIWTSGSGILRISYDSRNEFASVPYPSNSGVG
jgi:hypothetical protein